MQFASWNWIFWLEAIVSASVVGVSILLIPEHKPKETKDGLAKWKSLDVIGVSILIGERRAFNSQLKKILTAFSSATLILFIFAITSASTSGWSSGRVLAPLIISVFMAAGFFFYETRIPAELAAIPPKTWFLPNFSVLLVSALSSHLWFVAVFVLFSSLWEDVWGWSAVSTAAHL